MTTEEDLLGDQDGFEDYDLDDEIEDEEVVEDDNADADDGTDDDGLNLEALLSDEKGEDDQGDDDGGKMVPLAALHEARNQNRQLREDLKTERAGNNPGETNSENKEDKPDELESALNDILPDTEDIVSGKEVKDVVIAALKADRQTRARESQDAQAEVVEASIKEAQTMFTADKVGKTLGYGNVIELGMENLSRKDERDIRSADNPGRELYRVCIKRTPELLKAAKLRRSPTTKKKSTTTRRKQSERKFADSPTQQDNAAGQLYEDLMS